MNKDSYDISSMSPQRLVWDSPTHQQKRENNVSDEWDVASLFITDHHRTRRPTWCDTLDISHHVTMKTDGSLDMYDSRVNDVMHDNHSGSQTNRTGILSSYSVLPGAPIPVISTKSASPSPIRAELASARTISSESLPSELPIQPLTDETPESLSRRLYQHTKAIPDLSGHTARFLSMSSSTFLRDALACYLARFHFEDYPIDMALRYFLALEHLPSESQQIDRVLHAFSQRYTTCNSTILDADTAYLLTFSLLLLHTDLYGRHGCTRLTKASFVSLAGASRVPAVILEYLYDNTSLVEFVSIRDALMPLRKTRSIRKQQDALYKLIYTGRILNLQQWRGMLYEYTRFPFSYVSHEWAEHDIETTVSHAPQARVWFPIRQVRRWAPFPGVTPKEPVAPHHVRFLYMGTVRRYRGNSDMERDTMPLAGTGHWKTWGLILTGSTLFWCKDSSVIATLQHQIYSHERHWSLKVDEVMPLADAFCVQDHAAPRFLRLRVQQQWLVLEPEAHSLTTWLDQINHIASIGACKHVWDDAVWVPSGTTLAYKNIPGTNVGPLRTGALCHRHWICDTYMECARDAHMGRAQSMLAMTQYIVKQEERQAALIKEHDQSVQYARHLGILTPLRKTMRDQIEETIHDVSRALRSMQFELAFVSCRLVFLRAQQRLLKRQLDQHVYDMYASVG